MAPRRSDDPALIDYAPETIQAGVLVAGVAVRFARLLDVGQLHPRLRVILDHHRAQTEVAVTHQRSGAVGNRRQPADIESLIRCVPLCFRHFRRVAAAALLGKDSLRCQLQHVF